MDTRLFLIICSAVLLSSLVCNACYTNYDTCYNTFTAIPVPTGQDTTNYCNAAKTADECLNRDAGDCPESKEAPSRYTAYSQAIANIAASCKQAECGMKQQECSSKIVMAYSLAPQNGSTPDKATLTKMCPSMAGGLLCFETMKTDCPLHAGQITQLTQQYESFQDSYCPNNSVSTSMSVVSVLISLMVAMVTLVL